MALFNESQTGVSNKLPTYAGVFDAAQVTDNLETAADLVLARVGSAAAVPTPLWDLGSKVIEYGASALTEQQNFPEQSTAKDSMAQVLWALFTSLLEQLVAGVEALGGTPNVETQPAFNFAPPWMIQYRQF